MKTNDCKESYTLSFSGFKKDRVYMRNKTALWQFWMLSVRKFYGTSAH